MGNNQGFICVHIYNYSQSYSQGYSFIIMITGITCLGYFYNCSQNNHCISFIHYLMPQFPVFSSMGPTTFVQKVLQCNCLSGNTPRISIFNSQRSLCYTIVVNSTVTQIQSRVKKDIEIYKTEKQRARSRNEECEKTTTKQEVSEIIVTCEASVCLGHRLIDNTVTYNWKGVLYIYDTRQPSET